MRAVADNADLARLKAIDPALVASVTIFVGAGLSGVGGVLIGLEATFHPFMGFPSFKEVATLSLAERVAHLRKPEVRERILREKTERLAGDGSSIPPLVDQLRRDLTRPLRGRSASPRKPRPPPRAPRGRAATTGSRAADRGLARSQS
jgi:hypothetical protein